MSVAVADRSGAHREQRLSAAPAAVTIEHVSKTFRLPQQRYSTLKERALHPLRSRTFDELRAVQDVDVAIRQGEFFGIVGRNGSGKSTLLKCLAGIYRVDTGRISLNGRLSPFIELGVGFNPDLTARDNVVINAVMLGLSRREARRRFDEIIAFAELEEFLDLKLKNYSSGMSVRLAFSVAIQVDADILLVDEVLAVGDAAFQHKCYEQFHRLKARGKTIVFVTHDMSAVELFCDRAMLLERGKVMEIGEPRTIARAYNELNFGRLVHTENTDGDRYGDQAVAEIKAAWFEDATGERIFASGQNAPVRLAMEVEFHADAEEPVFAFHLRNESRHTVFATSTMLHQIPTGTYRAGDAVTVRARLDNWFAAGRYTLTPTVADQGSGNKTLDLREDLAALSVHATHSSGGVVELPHEITVERR